jgi:hypothetical protein
MRSYAMRGAVPVLFTSHLFKLTVTRHVSALNPALRIPPNVMGKFKKRYSEMTQIKEQPTLMFDSS